MTPSNIWLIDIETAPILAYVWGLWEQDVVGIKRDSYTLSFTAKKLGENKVICRALPDYKGYKANKEDDKALIKDLWDIFDDADIIIAHNGKSFDIRKVFTAFLFHGMKPPSPFKVVDTKIVAKQVFRFDSNRLDALGRFLGLGRKRKTDFELWEGCMAGNKKSWALMKKYNIQDVHLLESVYNKMLPYIPNHPNVNKGEFACNKCGSNNIQKRGFSFTLLRKKQRFQCTDCGGWFEGSAK